MSNLITYKEASAVTSVSKADMRRYMSRHPDIFVSKNDSAYGRKKKGKHEEWAVFNPDTGERMLWPERGSANYYGKGRELAVTMTLSRGSGDTREPEGRLFRDIIHLIGRMDDFPSLARSRGKSKGIMDVLPSLPQGPMLIPHWASYVIGLLGNYKNKNNKQVIKEIKRSLEHFAGVISDEEIETLFEKVRAGYTPAEITEAEVLVAIQLLNFDGDHATKDKILDTISRQVTKRNIEELNFNLERLIEAGDVTKDDKGYKSPILEKSSEIIILKLKKLAKFLKNN